MRSFILARELAIILIDRERAIVRESDIHNEAIRYGSKSKVGF